jgi:putative endonuclease
MIRPQHLHGRWGEELAVAWLMEQGMTILKRNWQFHHAEIDIIASDHDVLVIVEVKVGASTTFGRPEDRVGPKKRRLLATAGAAFARQTGREWEIRFDIISIIGRPGQPYHIDHFKDAFIPV